MRKTKGGAGRDNMRHGLISLLTVVVIISLATAAVLTVATSHAMDALARRQATMTAEGYDAERSAQTLLACLDEELGKARIAGEGAKKMRSRVKSRINSLLVESCAEGVGATYVMEDDVLTCTFTTKGGRMLQVRIRLQDDARYDILSWKLTAAPQEEETGDTLWSGSTTEE